MNLPYEYKISNKSKRILDRSIDSSGLIELQTKLVSGRMRISLQKRNNYKNGIFEKMRKMKHLLEVLSLLPTELETLYRLGPMFFGVIIL